MTGMRELRGSDPIKENGHTRTPYEPQSDDRGKRVTRLKDDQD